MGKANLPVMLLKGIILLPFHEIRLEFEEAANRSILDVAETFHDNYILVVSQTDPLEEKPAISELPKIGVVARISHKMELSNGKVRIMLSGLRRVHILEYLNVNRDEGLESIVSEIETVEIGEQEESAYVRKIKRELENYVKNIPYMSNSVLSVVQNVTKLDQLTDIVARHLPIEFERLYTYLLEEKAITRASMILEDIYEEQKMFQIEKELDLKVRDTLDETQREFVLREKLKYIKEELGDVSIKDKEIDQIRKKIVEGHYPKNIKKRLEEELKRYESLTPSSPEMNIVRTYIDWLLCLPWRICTKDNENLKEVRASLDKSHDGLDSIKTRIIEFLAVKKMTNGLHGPILCFTGPPGVGKTSLAISIAKAMHRKFVKVSVGGIHDEAEIVGHRRTYLGANPGRIIQSMKKAKSANPLFLIDEIDKMTKDYKGDPASALLEILDPEQNKYFSDNYIEEEFDLSRILFITTANDVDMIPEALKDRLEVVELSGYTEYEKLNIAKKHLLPKILKEHGLPEDKITISDEVFLHIIEHYTKEAGVRELQRQLATIVRKIVTMLVTNNIHMALIPVKIEELEKYLGKEKYHYSSIEEVSLPGIVNGLAYTVYGGDTITIEAIKMKGKGELLLTGSLGDVMKESAHLAFSYMKAHQQEFEIKMEHFDEIDIHIHVPEGAVPKDGPSAGITLTTTLISLFTGKKVSNQLAMTGEMTLQGRILAIGGLKEKAIGAYRNHVKTILIPFENQRDLVDIPKEVLDSIKFVPVKTYMEAYLYMKKNHLFI